jgi:hypothetical protein
VSQLLKDLQAINALLRNESKWTRFAPAKNKDGISTVPWEDDAVCWDIVGAIQNIVQREAIARESAIIQALYPSGNLAEFNDRNDFHTVKALIAKAIERNS